MVSLCCAVVRHNARPLFLQCLRLDPTFSDAHLFMAQIAMSRDDIKTANNALDQALSHNFQVRDSPVYHRIKAKILESKGELDESLAVLEAGMKVPGVKAVVRGVPPIAIQERASLFIQVRARP